MRPALLSLFAALALVSPALAANEHAYERRTMESSCSAFIADYGSPRLAGWHELVLDPVQDAGVLPGTPCAVTHYILQECRRHARMSVGEAIRGLERNVHDHRPLPQIPVCGA